MMDWIKLIINPCSSLRLPLEDCHKFQIFAAVACDLLWFHRNKAYHDNRKFDAIILSQQVNSVTLAHHLAWHPTLSVESWLPSPPLWFKINFDTAIRHTFSAQSAVCRDMKGCIIRIISQIGPSCTANYGEA
ncbi:hypothetical protein SLA2020_400730 [Shorea laevis]